ncbi:uncharacterized protein KGF55_000425 [Candida pseudojiufengensis]|uniref:uncharacterized protein n=1 Tax=Candida pseudojiufengensis TaxID=497109 RepID=UPI0022245C4C|nr:uncharacterized protein KGF55_000425 [Candida pseudojiufengensis]KAI5967015.1 hypothetical protein KGF55_000425 [Candida pseudojiufengensis]
MTNVLAKAASIRRKSSSNQQQQQSSTDKSKDNSNQTSTSSYNNYFNYTTQTSKKYFSFNSSSNNNNNNKNTNENNNNNKNENTTKNEISDINIKIITTTSNDDITQNQDLDTSKTNLNQKFIESESKSQAQSQSQSSSQNKSKSSFPPPPPIPISPTQLLRSSPSFTDSSPIQPPQSQPLQSSRGIRSSSSKVSLKSMKSSNSLSTINSKNNSNSNNDKLIKTLLKRYKKLELALNKFNSRKYNHTYNTNNPNNGAILKGNLLRTSLIPFLRSSNQLDQLFNKDSKIYKSLTSVILTVLLKWWNSLIGNLKYTINSIKPNLTQISSINQSEQIHYTNIPASDRNAYLECVSRIISRGDWHHYDEQNDYQALLTTTLDYCIDKLSTLKTLTGSMAAFIGKVFAYSFFKIPNVSNALMFLLNVKQINLENSLKILPQPEDIDEKIKLIKSKFPQHLHQLLNFQGIQNLTTRGQKCYMNCIPPPKHPVDGIKNPNGDWVRRWCGSDSNVFNSFLRHYIEIIRQKFINNNNEINLLLLCPGFNIIFSHIFQIFQIAINRITSNMKNSKEIIVPPFNINVKQSDMYYSSIIKIFRTIRDITYISTKDQSIDNISSNLVKVIDLCFISIAKETTIYDFNKNGIILGIINEFINHLDFNSFNNEIQYLINWEFWLSCNYMMINHCDHIQSLLKNFAFLFNIWDMIPDVLCSFITSKIDNISINDINYKWIINIEESIKLNFINYLISDFTFEKFFIHWNPLVRSYYIKLLIWRVIGINNYQSSFSIQTTRTLQSKLNESFEILQSYTILNNGKNELNFKPDNPLVNRKFSILPISSKDDYLSVSGDGLNGINNQSSEIYLSATTSLKSSELRKTHPYEIFDEAIYTCATVPSINENQNNISSNSNSNSSTANKNNSFVNSISKLLKILSDEEKNQDKIQQPPMKHSESSSSLSTSSYKSRSSSPSIMSFNSTPTSITETSSLKSDEFDENSSILTIDTLKLKDDSELPLNNQKQIKHKQPDQNQQQNYNIQPPELSKLPPDIIRPIFKFDIIVCHESMNEKFQIINSKNSIINQNCYNGYFNKNQNNIYFNNNYGNNLNYQHYDQSHQSVLNFPKIPKLPYISLFINSDLYNHKFYLNEEDDDDGIYLENLSNQEDDEGDDEHETKHSLFNLKNNESSNISILNLGKSLNEINIIIEEFKFFLKQRIDIDNLKFENLKNLKNSNNTNFNNEPGFNSIADNGEDIDDNFNEFIYLKRIIPFLSVDSSNELKLLNAN